MSLIISTSCLRYRLIFATLLLKTNLYIYFQKVVFQEGLFVAISILKSLLRKKGQHVTDTSPVVILFCCAVNMWKHEAHGKRLIFYTVYTFWKNTSNLNTNLRERPSYAV